MVWYGSYRSQTHTQTHTNHISIFFAFRTENIFPKFLSFSEWMRTGNEISCVWFGSSFINASGVNRFICGVQVKNSVAVWFFENRWLTCCWQHHTKHSIAYMVWTSFKCGWSKSQTVTPFTQTTELKSVRMKNNENKNMNIHSKQHPVSIENRYVLHLDELKKNETKRNDRNAFQKLNVSFYLSFHLFRIHWHWFWS